MSDDHTTVEKSMNTEEAGGCPVDHSTGSVVMPSPVKPSGITAR